jgi:hypothetical protein
MPQGGQRPGRAIGERLCLQRGRLGYQAGHIDQGLVHLRRSRPVCLATQDGNAIVTSLDEMARPGTWEISARDGAAAADIRQTWCAVETRC